MRAIGPVAGFLLTGMMCFGKYDYDMSIFGYVYLRFVSMAAFSDVRRLRALPSEAEAGWNAVRIGIRSGLSACRSVCGPLRLPVASVRIKRDRPAEFHFGGAIVGGSDPYGSA